MGAAISGLKDAAKPQFSNRTMVGGSGASVGDMRNGGYSDSDLDTMGVKRATPSDLQSGLASGLSAGTMNMDAPPAPRGPVTPIDVPNPQFPVSMSDPSYLKRMTQPLNKKAFMGGKG